jgi:hypothetical protein
VERKQALTPKAFLLSSIFPVSVDELSDETGKKTRTRRADRQNAQGVDQLNLKPGRSLFCRP